MTCAVSCLNEDRCMAFEHDGRMCKKIRFLRIIELADKDAAPNSEIKPVWLSSILSKNKNYPDVPRKINLQ